MWWVEDFARSRDRQHAALAALAGVAAVALIELAGQNPHPVWVVVITALLIVPGWHLHRRLRQWLGPRTRGRLWWWPSVSEFALLRLALLLARILLYLAVSPLTTVGCAVLALVPARWMSRPSSGKSPPPQR